MAVYLKQFPRFLAERRGPVILGLIVVLLLWLGVAAKHVNDLRGALQDSERTTHNFAMVFEENVLRSIGEIDKALLYMRRSIESRAGREDYGTIVNTTDLLSEIIVQVAIIGQDDLVYHALRDRTGKWSGFNAVNGYGGAANFAARDVSIAITRNAALKINTAHIVANGLAEGKVFHRVRWADGSWTPWAMVYGTPAQTSSVAVAIADNDDAYVMTNSPTQGLMRNMRVGSDGSWTNWRAMSNQPQGPVKDIALSIRGDGISNSDAYLSYVDAQGKLWYRAVPSPFYGIPWTDPAYQPTQVMSTGGRTVSVNYNANTGVELLAVQAQPQ